MSENDMHHEDVDIKEDFSGFTEISVKDTTQPTQFPPKIDVSEAVAQAQSQSQSREPEYMNDAIDDEQEPQLPGAVRMLPRPPFQRPTFWQTLINRGLIALAIAAVGILVWWWWSKNNNTSGPLEAAEAAVNAARKTVVEPIQKALKLPPNL
jgi:hypothetical protein